MHESRQGVTTHLWQITRSKAMKRCKSGRMLCLKQPTYLAYINSQRHGLNYIYNRLLSTLLREEIHIDTLKVIPSIVMRRFRCMKAFVVGLVVGYERRKHSHCDDEEQRCALSPENELSKLP
ncbi:disease resistance protein RUN1 [Trifolium repens]|nr:disease resistance protein RUN1 [Trifolium repens]